MSDVILTYAPLINLTFSLMLVKVKDWTFAEAIFIPIDLKAASWVVCWSVAIAIINWAANTIKDWWAFVIGFLLLFFLK